MNGGLGRKQARGDGGGLSSRQVEHVASSKGLRNAPTHANTFGFSALFVEISIRDKDEAKKAHLCACMDAS